jgi:hypothetical protein
MAINRHLSMALDTPVLSELRDAMAEVVALGRGVYPPALARGDS